jgi:hypothetical protein
MIGTTGLLQGMQSMSSSRGDLSYLLDRLQQDGALTVHAESGARGACGERLIYALTDQGRARFSDLLRAILRTFDPVHTGVDVAVVFLLLCGKESPMFHPGQALQCLFANGVDAEHRIIGAVGHLPLLQNLPAARIAAFRQQIELVDATGQTDSAIIAAQVAALLARSPGPFTAALAAAADPASADDGAELRFVPIRPGGQRAPLVYDPKVVITLDRAARQIVLRHYLPDNTPAHEMRDHAAEAMLLGLLREDLVSQMSHAGYLGGELAKAETALRLGLRYEQDQPQRGAGN